MNVWMAERSPVPTEIADDVPASQEVEEISASQAPGCISAGAKDQSNDSKQDIQSTNKYSHLVGPSERPKKPTRYKHSSPKSKSGQAEHPVKEVSAEGNVNTKEDELRAEVWLSYPKACVERSDGPCNS